MDESSHMSQNVTEFTDIPTDSDLATWYKVLSGQSVQDTMTKFEISKYGFLPESCDTILTENFKFLEHCVSMIPETKSFGEQFREIVSDLPIYNPQIHQITGLSYSQKANLFSLLTIIINRYIWCQGIEDAQNYNQIPAILSVPLYELSEDLGVVPTLSHGSIDLWNWKLTDKSKPFNLDNIDILHTMTGTESEEWFYKIMICIEGLSGEVVAISHEISKYYSNSQIILSLLKVMNLKIKESVQIINRIYEHCDPDVFFDKIRIYLSGSLNDNLPQGIIFDLHPLGLGTKTYRLHGGSAAQSTLFQIYDILFGIQHTGHGKEFLDKMRHYMPESHRVFAEELAKTLSIKKYIELSVGLDLHSNKNSLKYMFEQCVKNITNLRKIHLMIEDRKNADLITNAHGDKGSGGTNLIVFCKEIIDDSISAIKLHDYSSLKNQRIDFELNYLIDRPGDRYGSIKSDGIQDIKNMTCIVRNVYTDRQKCKSYTLLSIIIGIIAILIYSMIKY
jgi:indoleamine 2,3-dioxygenase